MNIQEPTVNKESKNLHLYTCAHNTLDKNDHDVQVTVPEVPKNCNSSWNPRSSNSSWNPKTLETDKTVYDPQLRRYFM